MSQPHSHPFEEDCRDGCPSWEDFAPDDDGPDVGVDMVIIRGDDGTVIHQLHAGPYTTESAEHIMGTLFPRFAAHFLPKNADYGDQHRYALGPRAEWVGIDRKVTKLEHAIWNESEMNGEQVEEMLYDMIGQCFILLDLLDGNWEPRSRNVRKSP